MSEMGLREIPISNPRIFYMDLQGILVLNLRICYIGFWEIAVSNPKIEHYVGLM